MSSILDPFDFLGAVDTWQGRRASTVKLATIAAVESDGMRVTFDGEANPTTKSYRYLNAAPSIGDRVLLHRVGSSWVILGAVKP